MFSKGYNVGPEFYYPLRDHHQTVDEDNKQDRSTILFSNPSQIQLTKQDIRVQRSLFDHIQLVFLCNTQK